MAGIKESKELIEGSVVVLAHLIVRLKDGFQFDDLPSIFSKVALDPEVREALKGVQNIGDELKDLSVEEVVELVQVLVAKFPEILAAFKK